MAVVADNTFKLNLTKVKELLIANPSACGALKHVAEQWALELYREAAGISDPVKSTKISSEAKAVEDFVNMLTSFNKELNENKAKRKW